MNYTDICNNLEPHQFEKLKYLSIRLDKYSIISELHKCMLFYKEAFGKILEKDDTMYYYTNTHVSHPLHFELGHVIHFCEYHFLGNIKKYSYIKTTKQNLLNNNSHSNIFDSLINKSHERKDHYVYSVDEQMTYAQHIIGMIVNELEMYSHSLLSPLDTYILELCLLHFEMHKEAMYFITNQQHIDIPLPLKNVYVNYTNPSNTRVNNEWIFIDTCTNRIIDIGCYKDQEKEKRIVIFDNECPEHLKRVNSFCCQKYPVTYGEYMEFIYNDGYKTMRYWSFEGWNWREKNSIVHPINIMYKENKWYRKHYNKIIALDYELPVVHVSYYEAQAYAKYKNANVISEEEYVYLSTNGGSTDYPWGNSTNIECYCNSNYINSDVIKVNSDLHKKGVNTWGIYGLMGDCWYWTSSRFLPFDGFAIDPIYDTFSYPFFYSKFIVKGSSWCTGKDLVYSKYRNAQEPDKCFQFTGIRLCRPTN